MQVETKVGMYKSETILYSVQLGMDRFFFFKRSFCYENKNEKTKNETIVFKTTVFLKRFH